MAIRTTSPRAARLAALVAGCVLLPLAAGCASSSSSPRAGDQVTEVQQLHAMLPSAIRADDRIEIATDASYAPASSFGPDGRTIVGFEPDLGKALGQVLGVKVTFRDADFGTLPGLVTRGRADLIMSAMTDTAERERTLDFVDYFSAGTSLVVQRGNPHGVSDLDSLCGQHVAVQAGTVELQLLQRLQPRCGASAMKITVTPTNDDALLQLRTGQVAAVPMDFPPAELLTTATRTSGDYQLSGTEQYEPGLYGIGVAKGDHALATAVRGALQRLIADGEYRRILKSWHVADGAVRSATINAAARSASGS